MGSCRVRSQNNRLLFASTGAATSVLAATATIAAAASFSSATATVTSSFSVQIAGGSDDLDYRPTAGWVGDTTGQYRVGLDTVERAGILRFILPKAIPAGATITSATLDMYVDVAGMGSGWTITNSVADAANPAMPTSNAEVDAFTWRDSATTWQPSALEADVRYDTTSFADALQTVVTNQSGLSSSAAILIKQSDPGAVAGSRLARFESYDGSVSVIGNGTRSAILEVSWTT